MTERSSFYVLLDLDPAISGRLDIEQRIQAKKREWSAAVSMGNPADKRRAQMNMAWLGEMERKLGDSSFWTAEASAARAHHEAQRTAAKKTLVGRIELLRASGHCTSEQLALMITEFGKALSEKEIRSGIAAAGLHIDATAGAAPGRPVKEVLDAATANNIHDGLIRLGFANLYKLLDRNAQNSLHTLHERADEINKEILGAGRIDPESTLRKELCGYALTIFRTDADKSRYDNTLVVQSMQQLVHGIELAGADRVITPKELNELIRQARTLHVPVDDARAFIEEYARKRKFVIIPTEGEVPAARLKLCGYCSTLAADEKARRCGHCGEPLSIACPQCGRDTPTEQNACSDCGCTTGDAPVVQRHFAEGNRLQSEGDIVQAIAAFSRALSYWPDWRPAQDAKKAAQATHQARGVEFARIESVAGALRLVEALAALERFVRAHGAAGTAALKARVEDGLLQANAACAQADQAKARGRLDEAAERYTEALSLCADHERARAGALMCPPAAPTELRVVATAAGFQLSWSPAAARGATFRVVRKTGAFPCDERDGDAIHEVAGAFLDDGNPPGGFPCFYSVYTIRAGIASPEAARSGPHLLALEVGALDVIAADGQVTLRWKTPPGCSRVEVYRAEGRPPKGRGDGVAVPISRDSAHDTGLVNEKTYGYLVACIYANPVRSAPEFVTTGLYRTVCPVSPPRPVLDLRCRREGNTAILSWTPVPNATVQVRQASAPPQELAGTVVSLEDAERFGSLVPSMTASSAHAALTSQGHVYFVPLSVNARTAVVGELALLTLLNDVEDLDAQAGGRTITLTWRWPPGIEEVLVLWSNTAYPSRCTGGDAASVRVTRAEYERQRCWQLRTSAPNLHYFTVFAKSPNSTGYSAGVSRLETMGQSVVVNYRVVLEKNFLRTVKQAWIELHCERPITLPGLVVLSRRQYVPTSPLNGVEIARINALSFHEGSARIPLPASSLDASRFVKVFFQDAQASGEYRLLPGPMEQLRLG